MRSKLDVSTPPKAGNETINKLLKICAEMGCTFLDILPRLKSGDSYR